MLDDIDSMLVTKAVKKEGSSAPLPRSNPPTTRGKTSAKKKKKPSDSTEPNLLADAVAHELHKFANQSIDLLLKSYEDLVKENADLLQRVADFKHVEDTQRNLLKEKLQDLNQVNKKLHTIESKHAQEMEDVMAQAKRSAALTVYHARIKMAKEVNDPGFDRAKWDVEAWKKLVADLQDEPEDEEVGVSGVDKSIEKEDIGEKVAVQGGGEGIEKA